MEQISDNIDAVADSTTVANGKEALLEQGQRDEPSCRECHGRQSGCGERAGQIRDVITALSLLWEFDWAALLGVALFLPSRWRQERPRNQNAHQTLKARGLTERNEIMRTPVLALLSAATLLSGCVGSYGDRPAYAGGRNYDFNRPDPAYGGYYADRYYRDAPTYRERRLSRNERIYRGENGQYYCRRSDGTTGLIVGGIAGGVLGNIIAPGGSKTLGTILGGIGGAAAGTAIDRNGARCR